jgi:hypothetical protein
MLQHLNVQSGDLISAALCKGDKAKKVSWRAQQAHMSCSTSSYMVTLVLTDPAGP